MFLRLTGSLIALAICAFPAHAQSRPSSAEARYKMFQDYLVRRAAEVTRGNLADVKTLADWQRRRPEVKRQMLSMLGLDPMPKRTPLNVRITGRFEREEHRVENIVFESMPGLFVTGNLYLPKRVQGRLPAVVYLSGHSPGPSGAKVHYQHHGIWLARHGYVALLIDTIEFGEVAGIHHGLHDLEMWDWLSLGYTPAGPETWNAIRAVDYLETRPEVDRKRIGVTGISGGGAITWYSAAVDERLQVAAPVCATWTVGHHAELDAVHENCDCIYFVNTFQADLPVLAALIAPRPLKIISARRDASFPAAGYHDVYARARPVYEFYGAGDKIQEYDHDAPHSDILPFRKEANEWLNRWLKNDSSPFDEGEIRKEEPSTLTVLGGPPADAINGHVHRTFIPAARLRPPRSLDAWKKRAPELLAELKDKGLRAWPNDKAPFGAWKEESKDWASRYSRPYDVEFNTEEGIRVTGRIYLPRSAKATPPALIYVKGRQDVVYPIDYDPLLGVLRDHVVLVLQPRAADHKMSNYQMATMKRTAALIGATLESMQAWDVVRAVDYLQEQAGIARFSSLSVYARKEMAVPVIYAAALDQRITRVVLDDPPVSHWQGPAILSALRSTDLPEVAALIAPRELVWLTPLPEPYRFTAGIYRLHGMAGRMREAMSLTDALQAPQQR